MKIYGMNRFAKDCLNQICIRGVVAFGQIP